MRNERDIMRKGRDIEREGDRGGRKEADKLGGREIYMDGGW